RLFVNDVLRHEKLTGYVGAPRYPATYKVQIFTPVGATPYEIPRPVLAGDWQLRPADSAGNPVVLFVTPSFGSLVAGADVLEKEFINGTAPGAYSLVARIPTGDDIYMEDAVPAGGSTFAGGGDTFTFGSTTPSPFSGTSRHKHALIAGSHNHGFNA